VTAAIVELMVDAALAGGVVLFALACVWPQLQWHRARDFAFVLVIAAAYTIAALFTVRELVAVPPWVSLLPLAVLGIAWVAPALFTRVLGGSQPMAPDVATAVEATGRAWEQLELGDIDAASSVLDSITDRLTPRTQPLVAQWRTLLAEEMGRRRGERHSSAETRIQIGRMAQALATRGTAPPGRIIVAAALVAAIIGAAPAAVGATTCTRAALLAGHAASTEERSTTLAATLVQDPEPGATVAYDGPLDLVAAAESRHDPDTEQQLRQAGFVAGYERVWRAQDGRVLSAGVFEFATIDGALEYQGQVNAHACRYANVSFDGPTPGVGLQVRYGHGDPIVEQFSWVTGTRRYVVAVGLPAVPATHQRILAIAQRAALQAAE